MNISLDIYKDLSNPKEEYINMQIDRSVDKNEEEEETVDASIDPSIEDEYKTFIEDCHNDDKEINIVLVKRFILLFSENPTLSLDPISDTNFFDLIMLKFVKITEKDLEEPEDTIILLQSLTILLNVLAFDYKFLRKEFIPQLIFMMTTSNDTIVELSLYCLSLLSEENIINRYIIRKIKQNQYKKFIEELWEIFNRYLANSETNHICQMVIQILGTFYQNNENEFVHLVLEKLNSILMNSDAFSLLAINKIKKYNKHTQIMADCKLIISIQIFLIKLQNQYQSKIEEFKLFISNIKESESLNEKAVKVLESNENSVQESTFSWSDFRLFLENEEIDESFLSYFNKIDNEMNEIIQGQIDSMSILNSLVDQLIFTDLNSELLLLVIQNFDYQRSEILVSETIHFIKQAITLILPFSNLFFNCLYKSENENDDLFDLLVHFSLNSPYKTRIEVGFLFTQLIRKADKELITKLFVKRKIDLLFQMISEFQDSALFNEMAESLFKLIDFKFGEQMKDDLQSIIQNVEEMAEHENKKVRLRANLLLKKIKEIIPMESEDENNSV